MIKIANEHLRAAFSENGAQITSLYDKKCERELIWQADPAFWKGQSPILFPATGGLWNATYRYKGRTYHMPKHGFVKDKTWKLAGQTPCSVTFAYEPKEEERELFPFSYSLKVTYTLCERQLAARFYVGNEGASPIYFQLGGHPAFNLPDFDPAKTVNAYIRFDSEPSHLLRAREQGCIEPGRFPVPLNADGVVPVCVETFANEALITEQSEVRRATLLDRQGQEVVSVASEAPCWLFWNMQGLHCPYVCFEPWYGLPDSEGFEGTLQERPYIQRAEPGTTWEGGFIIDVA